jgi:hypothetical protein
VLGRAVEVLVDPDQAGVLGVASGHRVALQRPEALRQLHVVCPRDVLVAEEEDLVLEQEVLDLAEDRGVIRGVGEADVAQLGADEGGEAVHLDGAGVGLLLAGLVNGGGHGGVSRCWG